MTETLGIRVRADVLGIYFENFRRRKRSYKSTLREVESDPQEAGLLQAKQQSQSEAKSVLGTHWQLLKLNVLRYCAICRPNALEPLLRHPEFGVRAEALKIARSYRAHAELLIPAIRDCFEMFRQSKRSPHWTQQNLDDREQTLLNGLKLLRRWKSAAKELAPELLKLAPCFVNSTSKLMMEAELLYGECLRLFANELAPELHNFVDAIMKLTLGPSRSLAFYFAGFQHCNLEARKLLITAVIPTIRSDETAIRRMGLDLLRTHVQTMIAELDLSGGKLNSVLYELKYELQLQVFLEADNTLQKQIYALIAVLEA